MYDEIEEKKLKVDKILKKKKHLCLMDMLFKDQDNYAFYVRLDYDKNIYAYKVIWVNLTQMDMKKAENWISSNLIYPYEVDRIKELFAKNGITEDYIDRDKINSRCVINSYITNYECNRKTFEFKRYIPKCWEFLADALYILFDSMPRYCYVLFQIMIERLINPSINGVFVFDLEHDDFNKLFDPLIIKRGLKYYEDERVIFIEKHEKTYYATVRGMQDYLVTIQRNKETLEIQMNCTCKYPSFCKHMYATLMAIKNGDEKKYFKIAYIDKNKNIFDNLKDFNYFLCTGIKDDYFEIVDDVDYNYLPIIYNNKLNFKIVEDNKKHDLEKELNKYLEKE